MLADECIGGISALDTLCKHTSPMAANSFPLNAWYAAAWRHEVGGGEILARTLCDRKIALWRRTDGAAVALEDACWHRLLPLSMGRLNGDSADGFRSIRASGSRTAASLPPSSVRAPKLAAPIA